MLMNIIRFLGVACGGDQLSLICEHCPRRNGTTWCNVDCYWDEVDDVCKANGKVTFCKRILYQHITIPFPYVKQYFSLFFILKSPTAAEKIATSVGRQSKTALNISRAELTLT